MSYSFDGVDDSIDFASDASIDAFSSMTVCAWISRSAFLAQNLILAKDRYVANWGFGFEDAAHNRLTFQRDWSTTDGKWVGSTEIATAALTHVALVYSDSLTSNDPSLYVNGVEESETETSTPNGSANTDAAATLRAGRTSVPGQPFAGLIGFVIYDNTLWSVADVNRHRWWGTRGGSIKCVYPLLVDAGNKGSATAAGTVSGAALASLPRVERCWMGMMGVGR